MRKSRTNLFRNTCITTIAMSLVLAGCSAGSGSEPSGSSKDSGKQPDKRGSITVAFLDQGNIPAEEGNPEKNRWTEWLNQNGPADVKVVTIPFTGAVEKYNVLFASGDAPDLIFTNRTDYLEQLRAQGLLLPLNDLIEKHSVEYKALLKQLPEIVKVNTKEDGKMYTFARSQGLAANHSMVIRDDWLKKLGLKVPQTTDELLEVAKAFVEKDPDGNNAKDTLGINLSFIGDLNTKNMFGFSGYTLQDGKLVRAWDNLRDTIEFRKRLYDGGLVDKSFLTDTNGKKAEQDFVTGKLGIYFMPQAAQTPGYNHFKAFKKNVPNGTYLPIPLPRSKYGQFTANFAPPISNWVAINAKAKDPVAVMKYIDFLNKESTGNTLKYGIEGTHWKKDASGCPEIIDRAKHAKEVAWNELYWNWVYPTLKFSKCEGGLYAKSSDPLDQEFAKLQPIVEEANVNRSRPMPGITHSNYMPNPPADLQLIVTNTQKAIDDALSRAVVSGASRTTDQAIAEVKDLWEKAGGKKVDEWYAKWYEDNKTKAFLYKDFYDFYDKQQQLLKQLK